MTQHVKGLEKNVNRNHLTSKDDESNISGDWSMSGINKSGK
jgi:hypothetical protein